MQNELRPCESATYVHFFNGGPRDGDRYPSSHRCDWIETNGVRYRRDGEAERMDEGPPGLQVLNCTDDYMEPIFFRVNMRVANA